MSPSGKLRRIWEHSHSSSTMNQVRWSKSEANNLSVNSQSPAATRHCLNGPDVASFITATLGPVQPRRPESPLAAAASVLRSIKQRTTVTVAARNFVRARILFALCAAFLLGSSSTRLHAQTDCLSCHSDVTLQDAAGHNAGVDADITIIDPELEWTFRKQDSFSRSRNTPFDGWNLKGRAVRTIVAGQTVWKI